MAAQKLRDKIDVYAMLKRSVVKLEPKHRFCCLLFDEYLVDSEIVPDKREEDNPQRYMIVFMLSSLSGSWKQPINNYIWTRFGEGEVLADLIVEVVQKVHKTGLTINATVSDHSKINIQAINHLMGDTPNDCYRYNIDYTTIYHIFDPCRLFKSFRNNFIENDITFESDGIRQQASWKFIEEMYRIDQERGELKMLPKLSIYHVDRKMCDRKTIARCAQVFSESVSKEIHRAIENGEIDISAKSTADLLVILDSLFDSCNGDVDDSVFPKYFKSAISVDSRHFQLWDISNTIFESMSFVKSDTNKIFRPSCLDLFPVTINNMLNIFKLLRKKKIRYLQTSKFNLECMSDITDIIRTVGEGGAELMDMCNNLGLLDKYVSYKIVDDK